MCSYDHQQRRRRSMARKDKIGKVWEKKIFLFSLGLAMGMLLVYAIEPVGV